jgi:hypothetical protein
MIPNLQKTADQLTELAETCDIVADRPMSDSGKEFWTKKRDFLRDLVAQLDNLQLSQTSCP